MLSAELVLAWEISLKAKSKLSSFLAFITETLYTSPLRIGLGISQEALRCILLEILWQNNLKLSEFLGFEQISWNYRDPLKTVVQ